MIASPTHATTDEANGSTCPLCGGVAAFLFERPVRRKYTGTFFYCRDCDYVFAASPFWLAEAYQDTKGLSTDTDVAVRNIFTALRLAALYYFALPGAGRGVYLDTAGGYGLLTRLLRDLGFDCYWSDLYAPNLFAPGFEYETQRRPCTAVSAVEVLEHTPNPLRFVEDTLADCGAAFMVFTTEVFPDGQPPAPDRWGYYILDSGQHISFFLKPGCGVSENAWACITTVWEDCTCILARSSPVCGSGSYRPNPWWSPWPCSPPDGWEAAETRTKPFCRHAPGEAGDDLCPGADRSSGVPVCCWHNAC